MKKNFIIVFGSAVTKKYRYGRFLPSDIDVMSDMPISDVSKIVTEWGKKELHASLPIDLHKCTSQDDILVPILREEEHEEGKGYIILRGTPLVHTYICNRGFASVLRTYGDDPQVLLEKLKTPFLLSLLPETENYYDNGEGEDKYYSGLKAFRNAAAHVKDLDRVLSCLNCGKLLNILLHQDADNWMASPDITKTPLPYGYGWNRAVVVYVSSDKKQPVLCCCAGNKKEEKNEDEAIQILFNL